jgi:hypothetical protein
MKEQALEEKELEVKVSGYMRTVKLTLFEPDQFFYR